MKSPPKETNLQSILDAEKITNIIPPMKINPLGRMLVTQEKKNLHKNLAMKCTRRVSAKVEEPKNPL